jgi:hypothetical protein
MNKISILAGFICLYIALVFHISAKTGQTFERSLLSIPRILAQITFDGQSSTTWYNETTGTSATVGWQPDPPPPPPVTSSTHSH